MKALLLLLITCTMASAAESLKWDEKEKTMQMNASDKTLEAKFGFTNTSDTPVEIRIVKVSCSCMSPKMEKRFYAPGEKGEITVVYTPGDATGRQFKPIIVKTSAERVLLKLYVDVNAPTS